MMICSMVNSSTAVGADAVSVVMCDPHSFATVGGVNE